MDLVSVESFNITDGTKRSFFRFPQSKVINFILVRPYPLAGFSIFVKPENQNTDYRDIEDHSMSFRENLYNKRVEILEIIRHAQGQHEYRHQYQHDGRRQQRLFYNRIEKLTYLLSSLL
jgi:hypothetical protein